MSAPPAARQLHGRPVEVTDIGGVQVPEPVDLGAADEAEVDQPLREQRHHVRHPGRPVRAGDVGRVAHRAQERLRRRRPQQPDLVQPERGRRVGRAGDREGEDGQPHADEDELAVADLARAATATIISCGV